MPACTDCNLICRCLLLMEMLAGSSSHPKKSCKHWRQKKQSGLLQEQCSHRSKLQSSLSRRLTRKPAACKLCMHICCMQAPAINMQICKQQVHKLLLAIFCMQTCCSQAAACTSQSCCMQHTNLLLTKCCMQSCCLQAACNGVLLAIHKTCCSYAAACNTQNCCSQAGACNTQTCCL